MESEEPLGKNPEENEPALANKVRNAVGGERIKVKVKVETSPEYEIEPAELVAFSPSVDNGLKMELGDDSDPETSEGADDDVSNLVPINTDSSEPGAVNPQEAMNGNLVHIVIDRDAVTDSVHAGRGVKFKFEIMNEPRVTQEPERVERNLDSDPDFIPQEVVPPKKMRHELQRNVRAKKEANGEKIQIRLRVPVQKRKVKAPAEENQETSNCKTMEEESPIVESQTSFVCDICGRGFAHKSAVNQHRRSHDNPDKNQVTCEDCGKVCSSRRRYEQHWHNVHSSVRPFTCDVCPLTFKSKSNLRRHLQTHSGEKPEKRFHCDICDQTFFFKCRLEEHKLRHEKEKPFECGECGKAYAWKEMLRDHEKIHRNPHAHTCSICGRVFASTLNLNRHLRLHKGETKQFVCYLCGKVMATTSSLTRHIGLHDAEKSGKFPFYCPHCKKGFTVKANLDRHILTHEGIKPFQCEMCSKCFSQNASLKAHRLIHTGDRPYSCQHCGKTFIQKSNLKTHMQKHNGQFALDALEEDIMQLQTANGISEANRLTGHFSTVSD